MAGFAGAAGACPASFGDGGGIWYSQQPGNCKMIVKGGNMSRFFDPEDYDFLTKFLSWPESYVDLSNRTRIIAQ